MKRLPSPRMHTILIMAALTFLITGCTASKTNHSGWLKDYSKLEKGPEGGVDYVYKKPGLDFGKYNKVKIDKVAFYFKQDSGAVGVQPDILIQQWAELLRKRLDEAHEN